MATFQKSRADAISYDGNWSEYQGEQTRLNNEYVEFKYYTATSSLTSCSFTFSFKPIIPTQGSSGEIRVSFFDFAGQTLLGEKNIYVNSESGGNQTVSFTGTFNTDFPVVRLTHESGPSGFYVRATGGTFIGEQVSLRVQANMNDWYIETDCIFSVTGRSGMRLRYDLQAWNWRTNEYDSVWSNNMAVDSVTVTGNESWFIRSNPNTSVLMKMIVSDTAGRTANAGLRLCREAISLQVSQSEIPIDAPLEITISDPYDRPLSYSIRAYDSQSYRSYVVENHNAFDIKNSLSLSLAETTFVQAQNRTNSCLIQVTFTDQKSRSSTVGYRLTRRGLTVAFIGYIDLTTSPITQYAKTGNEFKLQFGYRYSRRVSIMFSVNNIYVRTEDGQSQVWYGESDLVDITCLKRWFDDGRVSVTADRVQCMCRVSDEMLRQTDVYFEIRAGADMKPSIISVSSIPIQKEQWPQSLANYYVQNYTRLRIEAEVQTHTSSPIDSVVASSQQFGTIYLEYDEQADLYAGETQGNVWQDISYTVTATDKRNLSNAPFPALDISVLPYSSPSVSIDSYHRYNSEFRYEQENASADWIITHNLGKEPDVAVVDSNGKVIACDVQYTDNNTLALSFNEAVTGTAYIGGANDTGAYCLMVVRYAFSSLNDLNDKDTVVSVVGASAPPDDERTLAAYIATETYFFPADIEHSYQIFVTATDLLNEETKRVVLSTAGVIMDFLAGGKGIGLGKVAELQKCVEVNPEWKFKAATIELNGTDLGTFLAQIQQRLTNGGL